VRPTSRHVIEAALTLRRETGLMEIPVPVHRIAEAVVDLLDERGLPEGRDGMVVQHEGMTAITVNSRLASWGRKRFTVGHELGHVRLHEGTFECLSREMGSPSARDPREREANQFAAELLMPEPQFRDALGRDVPDLETIAELASDSGFNVSLTAAVLRAVGVTDHQCVLVVSHEGNIEWTATSRTFEVWTRREGPVPRNSASARVAKGKAHTILHESDDATAWLEDTRVRADMMELEEEAMAIGERWVVTLLNPVDEVDMDDLEAGRRAFRNEQVADWAAEPPGSWANTEDRP